MLNINAVTFNPSTVFVTNLVSDLRERQESIVTPRIAAFAGLIASPLDALAHLSLALAKILWLIGQGIHQQFFKSGHTIIQLDYCSKEQACTHIYKALQQTIIITEFALAIILPDIMIQCLKTQGLKNPPKPTSVSKFIKTNLHSLMEKTIGVCRVNKWVILIVGAACICIAIRTRRLVPSSVKGNTIFFTANEFGAKNVIEALKRHQFNTLFNKKGRCHVGVSGLFNLHIAAATRSEMIIMFDINPSTIAFNSQAVDLLKTARNGHDFAQSLADYCISSASFEYSHYQGLIYRDNGRPEEATLFNTFVSRSAGKDQAFKALFDRAFNGPYSVFNGTNGSFEYLQEIARAGKIISLHADLMRSDDINKIVDFLKNRSLHVGSLYLSNAYDWIKKSAGEAGVTSFVKNVNQLSDNATLLIEGISDPARTDNFYNIQLNVFYAKNPTSGKYDPADARTVDIYQRQLKCPGAPLLVQLGAIGEQ